MSDESRAGNTAPHHIAAWKVILIALALAVLIVVVWLAGYLPRHEREMAAVQAANEVKAAVPKVTAAKVVIAPADTQIVLPGSVSATAEASIYARATGYVKRRLVDVGDRVKEGQLLAELDTPELDLQVAQAKAAVAQARQQLLQAQAGVAQAAAQRDLAKVTFERYDNLLKKGAVAKQDTDQQESAYKSSAALVSAQEASVQAGEENIRQAQANLDRLAAMQDYKNVRSPVAGVVTARNIDTGYLISSTGAGQGSGPLDVPGAQNPAGGNEMFRVAQTGTLRILINVPQAGSTGIMIGMPAKVTVNEFPGRVFAGKVTRMTSTLDPNSRTMQVQIDLGNGDGKLFPGMYAQVALESHREKPPLLVPGDAIIAGQNGTQVAVLLGNEETKRIHLQTVQPGRDYGQQTEIISGLEGTELVVVNPGDEVREGNQVKAEVRTK